ncbi:uncharacterized protein LOC112588762 [Harpegnathos saltator]|uniref:uncharacterized protein LOC112588762 n=1 Tax=Harpegnathos saltator TaxID=610380 RepID=UPI000DBED812|nr:uncharacterized protein LOC112588762 [Harpegnathos saltator]
MRFNEIDLFQAEHSKKQQVTLKTAGIKILAVDREFCTPPLSQRVDWGMIGRIRLTNDAVVESWLVRGYWDARGDGTFRTATATFNTNRRIAATKIETRERGALSPLASSKDAAPRREHEDSARESTGFSSGNHQRQQHRDDHREQTHQ